MLMPTKMVQLIAVVLESDVEEVTKALLEAGIVHFIDTRPISRNASVPLTGVRESIPVRDIREQIKRIESILAAAGNLRPGAILDITKLNTLDLEACRTTIDRISDKIDVERVKQKSASDELDRIEDMRKQLDLFGSIDAGLKSASKFSYLSMQTGSIETQYLERFRQALAELPTVVVEARVEDDRTYLLLISLKRDEKPIDTILDRFSWDDVDLSSDMPRVEDRVGSSLDDRILELTGKREEAEKNIREISEKYRTELADLWEALKINELYARVCANYSRTRRTVVLSGWLPRERTDEIEADIHARCSERCYIEWRNPGEDEDNQAPVEMRNPKFLAPFELIVKNYSVPAYGTIDPTPLVAVSYLVMFALMFGDAGHGLVIALCGILGRTFYKKEGSARKLLTLLIWCGGASMIAGVLFGAYFGMQWFPPLWFDYHGVVTGHGGGDLVNNIYDVLAITVYFGVAVIGLGLILNWINLGMKRKWFPLIFDKAGILGGLIYGFGVGAAIYFVGHEYKQLPSGWLLGIFIGIPVLVLGLKAPLEYMRERRAGHGEPFHPLMAVDFLMEWIVEILEVFSGYLANTLSFMRVAGLGIAHEALMIAFFSIARMAGGGSITMVSVLILLAGNVLVILLEGLSAGIQSLRLNYYEFFSKYFTSAGRIYRPVSLRAET